MKRIIFVDDESRVLQGLRRMLRPLRAEWEMEFAQNGPGALEAMAKSSFDVIVADMRMPGMDGAQLLSEVQKRYPQTVRIVLSGHSNQEMVLRTVGPAHQYLAKPSDSETIKRTVARACALRDVLTDESIKSLVSGLKSLPSIPSLYLELTQELQSPEASIQEVGRIISRDVGMTAKILQLVNSAFFGLRRHVSCPSEAAGLLGVDTIGALVLSVGVFSEFDLARSPSFSPDRLWQHSMLVGSHAKRVSRSEKAEKKSIDDAFMAGLLHDAGKLVLCANLPVEYEKALVLAKEEDLSVTRAEKEVFHVAHAEVGAYLLGLWGFQDSIVEALAFHHSPREYLSQAFAPLTAVHVANAFAHESTDVEEPDESTQPDTEYMNDLGLRDRLPVWRQECHVTDKEAES